MKKNTLILLSSLVFLFNNSFKAQDNSAFEKGTIVASLGYGVPNLYRSTLRVAYNGYSSRSIRGFGPIILKGDYGIVKFKWGHSVGAGIVIGYNSTTIKFSSVDYYYYNNNNLAPRVYSQTDVYQTITIGARGSYHFFTKEKIDCYASVGLGFNINSSSQKTSDAGVVARTSVGRSAGYTAFTVGIRYYFTDNIGVYAEAGWDMSAPLQGGLALKF